MRGILAACVIVTFALAGCTVRYSTRERASAQGSTTTSEVSVASGSPLGNAIIVGVMLADGVRYYRLGPDGKTSVRAPEPDPTRKINVQDCTRPVDPNAGNLFCR
jgi:hypothetical protein